MKSIKNIIALLLVFSFLLSYAQEEITDDLGDVSDAFQNHYFEALKQKGIENYENAITSLLECKEIDSENVAVHFELGKNYYELDRYSLAEESLLKANNLKPKNKWILDALYQLYLTQKNDEKIINTLQELSSIQSKYKDDLVLFYFKKRDYNTALNLIDELDKETGTNRKREHLRSQIYHFSKKYDEHVTYIQKKIAKNTATEIDYTNLVFVYSQLNKPEKSFEAATAFEKKFPDSDEPHLSLYKFYLNENKIDKAIGSMHRVTNSTALKEDEKFKVVNDFLEFTRTHIEYLPELEQVAKQLNNQTILNKLALLYKSTNNEEKADSYIQSASETSSDNYEDLKVLGNLLLRSNKINDALKTSTRALELYPAQPIFYLQQAKAYNLKKEPKKALESLTFGLDYLIDDPKTEVEFYMEMASAYAQLNDTKNQQKYLQKAKKLIK